MDIKNYEVIKNDKLRLPTLDHGRLAISNNLMYGLLEIDITILRNNLRELRKQNKAVSLTAWMIKTVSDSICRNKYAQSMLLNKRKLILFDDVDFSLPIERKIGDIYLPFPLIIRSANKKTMYEIDKELAEEVNKKFENNTDPIFNGNKIGKMAFNLFYFLPQFVRVFVMNIILKNPFRTKKICGTVGMTTVNVSSRMSGWIIPTRNPYNLYFGIGSICKKPLVINDEIKIRDVLNLTVCFNHDAIDGTPARRFISDLVKQIENGLVNK